MRSGLTRVYEWDGPGYDVALLGRCLSARYRREGSAAEAAVPAALHALGSLWAAERCPVELSGPRIETLTLDASGPAGRLWTLIAGALEERRQAEPDAGWGLSAVGPAISGAVRLVIPHEAEESTDWVIASDEGHVSRRYALTPGPSLAGFPSRWLRAEDVDLASNLSLYLPPDGGAEATLRLGPSFYCPDSDPRPDDLEVRGLPLREWQAAAGRALAAVEAELAANGWQRI